ncbi:MAG: pantetheine-phosphate adenylyltransferase [Paracoccaceae bacterium]|nr:pantetheine-phosphate adenylyltransferase [Paracoccaceae bacterium]
MRIGLYPGTFDPLTFGHIDIIRRAAGLVDRLVVGVAVNRDKKPLLSIEERAETIKIQVCKISEYLDIDIVIHKFDNLLIDCAKDVGASVIFRGLRAVSDFEYEFQMVGMNRALNDKIETVFLMADVNHQAIASKLVKEIARLGGTITHFVPQEVASIMAKKFDQNHS